MIKRFFMLLVAALLLASAAHAQDAPDARSMARYFPADTLVFAALRTDDAFIEQLDALSRAIASRALVAQAVGLPPWTFREALREALPDADEDLDAVLAWLGDYAALGATELQAGTNLNPGGYYLVAQIDDRAAAEGYLERTVARDYARETVGGYTVYASDSLPNNFAVGDDVLLIYADEDAPPVFPVKEPLSQDADFMQAAGGLAAAQYNAVLYVDVPGLAAQSVETGAVPPDPVTQAMLDQSGPLAVGLTILDGRTFTIDTAQVLPEGAAAAPAVDPAFARFIPQNASAAVLAHDLSSLWDNLGSFVDEVNALTGPEGGTSSATQQIDLSLRLFGINLSQDLWSWATGEYALFLRTDLVDLIGDALDGRLDTVSPNDKVDFGLLIEATDAAKASAFAAKIGALLTQVGAQERRGVTVSSDRLSGVDVTVLSLEAPIDRETTVRIEIVVGANEQVFFVATRPAAVTMLSGGGGLDANPAFSEALAHALPQTSTLWYTDGEGLIAGVGGVGTVTGLALLGPAIGGVFSNIVEGLNGGTPVPTPTPTPIPTPMVGQLTVEQFVELLRQSIAATRSSAASAVVTADGIARLRLTLTAAAR